MPGSDLLRRGFGRALDAPLVGFSKARADLGKRGVAAMILAIEIGEDPAHVQRRRDRDAELGKLAVDALGVAAIEGLDEGVRRFAVS